MTTNGFVKYVAGHGRMWALLLVVLAIVGLPYLSTRSTADAALQAKAWVAHSEEVRATTYQITYRLRDMEAAAYALLANDAPAEMRVRIQQAQAQVTPLLAELRRLTTDNPQQQTRIGELTGIAERRVDLMNKAMASHAAHNDGAAYASLADASRLLRYSHVADVIVTYERDILKQRGAAAVHKGRYSRWLLAVTTLAQLLLLGSVVILSQRQVTHRRSAELTAHEAVERSQRIVQTVREPMVVLDADLNVLMSNPAFVELYGDGPELDGFHTPLALIGDDAWSDGALLQRLGDVIARDRELWDYELAQTTADGVERHMLINARRMKLPDGDAPALLLTVNDVTARKLAEDEITELNEQLEGKVEQISEVNRELEAFSYSVSHDLRAPLRHISGFSDKLGEHLGDQVDEKTSHYLGVIREAAQRMAQSIDDLLVYSRLGRGALRLQPVDMQSLVEQTRALAMNGAGERDIEWRINPLPVVVGDENMLRTVWQNLLENAVKYTGKCEHAEITIAVKHAPRGGYVFSVTDNGAGFDMRYVDKLFGVFQRLHKASDFPGNGIGLANVRRIIARHGGRTSAQGQPGQGATFSFSLPATNNPRT